MGRLEPQTERESRLVGKVCDLCRVLETGISVVLMVRSSLRILFDQNNFGYFMMMVTVDDNNSGL